MERKRDVAAVRQNFKWHCKPTVELVRRPERRNIRVSLGQFLDHTDMVLVAGSIFSVKSIVTDQLTPYQFIQA